MSRIAFFAVLAALLSARAQAQSSPDNAPPVPPETEGALAPDNRAPATTPQSLPTREPPSAAEAVIAPSEALAPTPQPAPSADNPYPIEAAPEFGPKPPAAAASETPTNAPPPAAPPSTPQPKMLSLAALVGVGVTFDRTLGDVNPLGFGFGMRGDYRVMDDFRVGARLLYFVGGSSELPTGHIDMQTWIVALEGSYALQLDPIIIQPGLALGLSARSTHGLPAFTGTAGQSFISGSQDQTAVGLYLAPGVNVVVPLSSLSRELDMFFVGGDLRFDLVFGSSVSANLELLAQAGLRL